MNGTAPPPQARDMEESAPLSRSLAKAILSQLNLAVVEVDGDLDILAHTAGLKAVVHWPGGKMVGRSILDLFPELIGAEEELAAVARGQSARFELPTINRLVPPGMDRRYLSLMALPHPDTPERLVLLVQDVTSQGRLGQQVMQQFNEVRLLRHQLEVANERLVRLDGEKSAFLRMAAHDLRAPLTVIKLYAQAVMDKVETLGEEAVEFLEVVLARTDQMARLIDSLLDVERIESGEVALDRRPLDLAALVAQVGEGFSHEARQKGVALGWSAPPDLPWPLADRERLAQVLNNLVSNALKFTPPGGKVTVEVAQQGAGLTVQVNDTGCGICEADQAHLFQRFFRSDEARQRRIAGSGLGLSIVKAIVEQHGGHVFCRSQLGQGSTFGFSLPLAGGE